MFTTSRYASAGTREVARAMAGKRKESYLGRGKRTVEQLAAIARKEGEGHIYIIEEKHGRASLLVTIDVDEAGSWKWAGEERLEDV